MSTVALRVEAPLVSFRNPHAREYAETYRVPPPSTVYGMLLSMVGEERRVRHSGARLALAVLGEPTVSTVLRTVWRVKNLARLSISLSRVRGRTRTETLRFLRAYLPWGLSPLSGWKDVWRATERAVKAKHRRNRRRGRPIS